MLNYLIMLKKKLLNKKQMILKELENLETEYGNITITINKFKDGNYIGELLDDPDICVIGNSYKNTKEKLKNKLEFKLSNFKSDITKILFKK